MKVYNKFHVVFQIAYVHMIIRVVAGLINNLAFLPIPINLPFAPSESGIVFDSFSVVLLICYGIWNRFKVYYHCADDHIIRWKEEKEWEELFAEFLEEDFGEGDDEYEEDEEYIEDKEFEEIILEKVWLFYKSNFGKLKKNLRKIFKESRSLKVMSIVSAVLLFFCLWNGILDHLDWTCRDVDYYRVMEEYYDEQLYDEPVYDEPSNENYLDDSSGIYT